ncbi:MAG: multiheme c-type cytochrome [Marinibacterium sp.]|nr:multiheme c-type cytochrome [Marinibacterium sp.]
MKAGFAALALLFTASLAQAQVQDGRGYVGSDACTDCHQDAAADWQGSHHALAWTPATPDRIRADFDGTRFDLDDMSARFRIDPDGTPHVSVTERDGVTTDYPVHSVVGVEPLQQYLLETEPGRLQSFDVVWDTEKGGWFHLYPDQNPPPDDALHWSGPYKNWNARCAECHATGFEKNYDPATRSYASTQVEIGVGCEACHGPGQRHLDWALETTRTPPPENYGFTVDFSDPQATLDQCATCHSRREAHLDGNPIPGTPYHNAYNLALLRPGLYEADGQILDEVYVYGSFLQSKMHEKGVTCLDCHRPHEAELKTQGNAICTQCHNPGGNPAFASLPLADYDTPEHHHHPEGAQCTSCHAVERVYMGNDWRADHSFRVPRPDVAAVTGGADACTTCHTDRDAAWAADQLTVWYPDSQHRGPHYGLTLAQGRIAPFEASGDLADLALDRSAPGIVRATALWLLEQSGDAGAADRVEPLLSDPDPVIRAAAIGAQRLAPATTRVQRVVGLLDDPVRTVRIAAARQMIDAPVARWPNRIERQLQGAMGEWQQSVGNRLDFPETHLQLAGVSLMLRNFAAADRAFVEALRLDPQRIEAWRMRVRIAAELQGAAAALAIVDQALAANPGDLGLLDMRQQLGGAPMPPDSLLPPQD